MYLYFLGFFYCKDTLFMLFRFSQSVFDSQETQHLAFGLVGMHSAAASIWAVTKFSHSSFGVCLPDVS